MASAHGYTVQHSNMESLLVVIRTLVDISPLSSHTKGCYIYLLGLLEDELQTHAVSTDNYDWMVAKINAVICLMNCDLSQASFGRPDDETAVQQFIEQLETM